MRAILFFVLTFLFSANMGAQKTIEKPNNLRTQSDLLTFKGLSFPEGVNGEIFKNLQINFQIVKKNQVEIQHFYNKFGTHEFTNSSFLLKRHINENLYLFAGPEAVFGINQENGLFESKQINMFGGVGYEANPNLLLELGYRARTYNGTNTTFGNPVHNSFMLRASF
ncbi:hypothetical protein [Aurantibacter sp.]|uniref:hypothetical protein n=1 Tax=Aurantibacter sp. TaxID=2807103 RepID=UPI003267C3B5